MDHSPFYCSDIKFTESVKKLMYFAINILKILSYNFESDGFRKY